MTPSILPADFCDVDGHVRDSWLRQPYRDRRGHYYPPLLEEEPAPRSPEPQAAKLREEVAFLKGQAAYLQRQVTELGKVRPAGSQPTARAEAQRRPGWQMKSKGQA